MNAPASFLAKNVANINLQIQAVLFETQPERLLLALESIQKAAEFATKKYRVSGTNLKVQVRYGDASPNRVLSPELITQWQEKFAISFDFDYDYFNENTGFGAGHNRLAKDTEADFLFIVNPDVVCAPPALFTLLESLKTPGVGIVDAKQLPVEHPKDFDPQSGLTSWTSGACLLLPTQLFNQVGGFDAETFFMYCEDVDLSWQVQLAGYQAINQPAAVVFHDKEISANGSWNPSDWELKYSAQAALLLAYKWSQTALADFMRADWEKLNEPHLTAAISHFEDLSSRGALPAQLDSDYQVGKFTGATYGKHRYDLLARVETKLNPTPKPAQHLSGDEAKLSVLVLLPELSGSLELQQFELQKLQETLTALLAQKSANFEVLCAPASPITPAGREAFEKFAGQAENLVAAFPRTFAAGVTIFSDLKEAVTQANGAWLSVINNGDVPFAHWVSSFQDYTDADATWAKKIILRAHSFSQETDVVNVLNRPGVRSLSGFTTAGQSGAYPLVEFLKRLEALRKPVSSLAFEIVFDALERQLESIEIAEFTLLKRTWGFLDSYRENYRQELLQQISLLLHSRRWRYTLPLRKVNAILKKSQAISATSLPAFANLPASELEVALANFQTSAAWRLGGKLVRA